MSTSTAIILAAGKGTRLRSVTGGEFPKPLTPLEGKPLIEYSIEALIQAGVTRVLLGCGHMIENFSYLEDQYPEVQIVENPKYDTLASIYTLLLFELLVEESFYLLESDLLYDPAVFDAIDDSQKEENIIFTSPALPLDDNVYFSSKDGILTSLSKEKVNDPKGVMTGIWRLKAGFLPRFGNYCRRVQISFKEDYEMMLAEYSSLQEPIHINHLETLNWCEIDNESHLEYALDNVLPKINHSQ